MFQPPVKFKPTKGLASPKAEETHVCKSTHITLSKFHNSHLNFIVMLQKSEFSPFYQKNLEYASDVIRNTFSLRMPQVCSFYTTQSSKCVFIKDFVFVATTTGAADRDRQSSMRKFLRISWRCVGACQSQQHRTTHFRTRRLVTGTDWHVLRLLRRRVGVGGDTCRRSGLLTIVHLHQQPRTCAESHALRVFVRRP